MNLRYWREGWLVLVLAGVFGAALAGVHAALGPRIGLNKEQDTVGQIPALAPGAIGGALVDLGGMAVYAARDAVGQPVGYILNARGQGFADVIELLVGINSDGSRITGLYILDQKETPGLGNRIVMPDAATYEVAQHNDPAEAYGRAGAANAFRLQFSGKSTAVPLVVTKAGDAAPENERIDAVTGATISSESVVEIVNQAVARLCAALTVTPREVIP